MVKKYGKFTYEDKLTIGRPMKDPQQQRIKELEAQLAKKEEELKVFKRFIEIAERELKIDIVKVWFQAVEEININSSLTIYELCELFGYTKQAFYKRKSKVKTPKYNSELLRSLVVTIRKQLP